MSQGRRLINIIKRRALTYAQMQMLWISTSPQKRVMECLLPGESVVKGKRDGLVTWRVVFVPLTKRTNASPRRIGR